MATQPAVKTSESLTTSTPPFDRFAGVCHCRHWEPLVWSLISCSAQCDIQRALPAARRSFRITGSHVALPALYRDSGLLVFGVAGLGLFLLAWLVGQDRLFPRALSYLGYIAAVLLVGLYLGRLIILDPTNPFIVLPALLSGFVLNPVWYLWLGTVFLRR